MPEYQLQTRSEPLTLSRYQGVLFVAVLLLAGFLRLSSINEGLPYFYKEDEAHHFNRVVQMMQTGDLNPHYFHKPSLHFYLRLPVAAASFLWTVKNGHIRSVHEIQTRDPAGIAGYAFTASHPGIVKWNRALSLLFCLGSIAGAMLITGLLTGSFPAVLLTGLLLSVSPDLISESAVIGVDMPVTFFTVMTAVAGIYAFQRKSLYWLYGSAIIAGLAVSTKYNALPVVMVPLLAATFSPRCLLHILLSPVVSFMAFLAASPFILVSIPLFLDQFAYEIWHYGIAGHAGHMEEPGFPQFIFYLKWLSFSAAGIVAMLLVVPGLWIFLRDRKGQIAAVFPVLFLFLMCNQRANFTRNMLIILPFIAALASCGIFWLSEQKRFSSTMVFIIAGILLIFQPAYLAIATIKEIKVSDTRDDVVKFLEREPDYRYDTALDGKLWLPRLIRSQNGKVVHSVKGTTRFTELPSVLALYNSGFDRIVFGPTADMSSSSTLLGVERVFKGNANSERVVKNPAVTVATIVPEEARKELLKSPELAASFEKEIAQCISEGKALSISVLPEGHCWINKRISALNVKDSSSLTFSLMSPWDAQMIRLSIPDGTDLISITPIQGKWEQLHVNIPAGVSQVILEITEVHSPLTRGISSDSRRLGIAIRK